MSKSLLTALTCLISMSTSAQDMGNFLIDLPSNSEDCATRGSFLLHAGKRGADGKRIPFSGETFGGGLNRKIRVPVGTYTLMGSLAVAHAPLQLRTVEIKKDQLTIIKMVNAKDIIESFKAKYPEGWVTLGIDHTMRAYQENFIEAVFFNPSNQIACRQHPGGCKFFEDAQAADNPGLLEGNLLKFSSKCDPANHDWQCSRIVRFDGPAFSRDYNLEGELFGWIFAKKPKRCKTGDLFVFPDTYLVNISLPDKRRVLEYGLSIR